MKLLQPPLMTNEIARLLDGESIGAGENKKEREATKVIFAFINLNQKMR